MEGVLKVVRRDNKRGYCNCSSPTASVDQLVVQRPGKMLRSRDPNAELRYLVEVDEALQASVIRRAWNGEFDVVADLDERGALAFKAFDVEKYETHKKVERDEYTSASNSDQKCPPESAYIPFEYYDVPSSLVAAYIHEEVAREYANPTEWPEDKLYQCQPCATNV